MGVLWSFQKLIITGNWTTGVSNINGVCAKYIRFKVIDIEVDFLPEILNILGT